MPARRWLAALALCLTPAAARAGTKRSSSHHAAPEPPDDVHEVVADPRGDLAATIAAEQASIAGALGIVEKKLADADATRVRRLRAAYRLLQIPLAPDASAPDRMASARRRAAARLLVERDVFERGLLANEADHLRAAKARTAAEAKQVASLALPRDLGWPAPGKIVRHFGTFVHARSHAKLSRRGIDLDVGAHAPIVACAPGVVRYAGPIRGLDHGVIVDHGTFYTVIGKLGALAVPVGTHVAKGDRLGRAVHHRIYLEVRVKLGPGGLPIDPEPLLVR